MLKKLPLIFTRAKSSQVSSAKEIQSINKFTNKDMSRSVLKPVLSEVFRASYEASTADSSLPMYDLGKKLAGPAYDITIKTETREGTTVKKQTMIISPANAAIGTEEKHIPRTTTTAPAPAPAPAPASAMHSSPSLVLQKENYTEMVAKNSRSEMAKKVDNLGSFRNFRSIIGNVLKPVFVGKGYEYTGKEMLGLVTNAYRILNIDQKKVLKTLNGTQLNGLREVVSSRMDVTSF